MNKGIKYQIKFLLQKLLGFNNYLKIFSIFKIFTLKQDKNERDFFCFVNILPEKGLIIDAGANIGIMTWHLAKKRPNSLIYSYEPIPINYSILNLIKLIFNLINCSTYRMALSDKPELLSMILPEVEMVQEQGLSHVIHENDDKTVFTGDFTDDTASTNSAENSTKNGSTTKGKLYQVPAFTIDQVFYEKIVITPQEVEQVTSEKIEALNSQNREEIDLKVSGIKIDVENYEWFVLKGASQILEHHSPIVYCELWPNEERTRCIKLMEDLDYSIFIALDEQRLTTFDPQKHDKHNFLFLSNKKIDQYRHLIQ